MVEKGEGEVSELNGYSWIFRSILILDALIASLILFFSRMLMRTEFGRASLIFGFIMLVIITLLGILRKLKINK